MVRCSEGLSWGDKGVDICTLAANLAGICGISLPVGKVEADGKQLPVGLQILGPHLGEETILQVASAVE